MKIEIPGVGRPLLCPAKIKPKLMHFLDCDILGQVSCGGHREASCFACPKVSLSVTSLPNPDPDPAIIYGPTHIPDPATSISFHVHNPASIVIIS